MWLIPKRPWETCFEIKCLLCACGFCRMSCKLEGGDNYKRYHSSLQQQEHRCTYQVGKWLWRPPYTKQDQRAIKHSACYLKRQNCTNTAHLSYSKTGNSRFLTCANVPAMLGYLSMVREQSCAGAEIFSNQKTSAFSYRVLVPELIRVAEADNNRLS